MGKRSRRRSSSSSSSSSTCSTCSSTSSKLISARKKVKKLRKQLRAHKKVLDEQTVSTPYTSLSVDESLIPVFDPANENISTKDWIDKVEQISSLYKWDNKLVVKIANSRLRGNARKWYDSLKESCKLWDNMKSLLLQTFPSKIKFGKLFVEAANYTHLPSQKLSDYCFEKLTRLRKLNLEISEENIIDCIIEGISNENIKLSARAANFQSVGLLANYLDHANQVNKFKTKNFVTNAPSSSKCYSDRPSGSETHKNKSDKVKLCYNCKGPHILKDCPKPLLKCELCHKVGHIKEQCFRNKNKKQYKVNNVTNSFNKNIYIKNIIVNDCSVKNCLIDTGSSCTLIKNSLFEMLNISKCVLDNEISLKCFMGNYITCNTVARVKVEIDESIGYVNAFIIDDNCLCYNMIIGCDYLNQSQIAMFKFNNTFWLKNISLVDVQTNSKVELSLDAINLGVTDNKEKYQVLNLLNEYADRISFGFQDLGKTNLVKMRIVCKSNEPVVYNPYRMSVYEKQILDNLLEELLNNGIIRESESAYASPVLLVKKKTGDYRMCVDFRKLNSLTVKQKFPLPLIDDQINMLGGHKYFITLDLASGYYQIPMDEDSIDKTAFITPTAHYEFLRMPFGLANAPAVFQKLINTVLKEYLNKIVYAYLDDLIIPAHTTEEALYRLRIVLDTLRQANLTLKLSKCNFLQTRITYLGREISEFGVQPGKEKVRAVMEMKEPSNIKEVRQFLGLSGYFRKFIKNYATITEPITRLLRNNVPFVWSQEQQGAFSKIKTTLVTRPILSIFDPDLKTELHTDASSLGFGAILIQRGRDNNQQVVGYFSKQTSPEQRHYHSYELETLAVVLALTHFRVYLLGISFIVVTDCSALRTAFTKKDLIPRVGRWWLQVQDYNFDIVHRPGSKMVHVDALSRNPITEYLHISAVDITEGDWIVAAQLQDDQLNIIRKILTEKVVNKSTKQYFDNYEINNDKIYRKQNGHKSLWVVPKACRWQICKLCHDDNGHFGVEKTLKKMLQNYWFPQARRFVKKYVQACLSCLYYKSTSGKKEGFLHPIEKIPIPFHTIHIDHLGPFETSKKKNKFLLVIVDGFTKFCFIEAVKDTKTKSVLAVLLNIFHIFGTPTRIISDRGTAFASATFKSFCETYGVRHILNAVATPRANGQCERFNRTILTALSCTAAGAPSNVWDTFIKKVQASINMSFNATIGMTPLEALAGYQGKSVTEGQLLSSIQEELERGNLDELRKRATNKNTDAQLKQKAIFDKSRKKAKVYTKGDVVMVMKTDAPNTGTSRKLLPKFKGPFRITKVLFNDRYEVQDLRENYRKLKTVVAVDKIKPWVILRDESDQESEGRLED